MTQTSLFQWSEFLPKNCHCIFRRMVALLFNIIYFSCIFHQVLYGIESTQVLDEIGSFIQHQIFSEGFFDTLWFQPLSSKNIFGTYHISDPPPPPLFFFFKGGGELNFDYLPRRRGNLKNFKMGVEVGCRGRSCYSWGGEGADIGLLNFFKVYYFYI